MATTILRIILIFPALLMLYTAMGWLFNPQETAAGFHMALNDGPGGNTQIGDITGFFFTIGIVMLLGIWKQKVEYLYCACIGLLGVALWRILAQMLYGFPALPEYLIAEFGFSALMIALIYQIRKANA